MSLIEIWVKKSDLRETRFITTEHPSLRESEIRVAIDKFALTANNVSYAVTGDTLGYWKFFPTSEEDWGRVCVWGMANVVESQHPEIEVGERIYGFLPMSSHQVLRPGRVRESHFTNDQAHRRALPTLYNSYNRCKSEPPVMQTFENERCALFPLFSTGFILADYVVDNDAFGAEQVIISAISSKTAFSCAAFLRSLGYEGRIVGLTSRAKLNFVKSLGLCDEVLTYIGAGTVSDAAAMYLDFSGDKDLRAKLHHRLRDNMKSSQHIGGTHWDTDMSFEDLPGKAPKLFFTPDQAAKRSKDWGTSKLREKTLTASMQLAMKLKGTLKFDSYFGAEAAISIWQDLLDNKVSGQRCIIVSPRDG